jgi:hypothetical protein
VGELVRSTKKQVDVNGTGVKKEETWTHAYFLISRESHEAAQNSSPRHVKNFRFCVTMVPQPGQT